MNENLLYANLTYRQYAALIILKFESGSWFNGYFVNNNDDQIIRENRSNSMVYYELLEGFTEEDCIIDIHSETLDALRDGGYRGFMPALDGYSKIKLELKELEFPPVGDTYTINFDKESLYDYKIFDMQLMSLSSQQWDYNNYTYTYKYYNLNNKELGTATFQEKRPREYENYKFDIGKDVTGDDDIIIELTEEEKSNIINSVGSDNNDFSLDNYSRLVIKFSDESYLDTDYVVDVKTEHLILSTLNQIAEDHNSKILDYVVDKGLLLARYCVYLFDTNNKKVVEIVESISGEYENMIVLPNITYRDNFYIKIDDIDNDSYLGDFVYTLRSAYGDNVKNIYIKLKNPEFLNGENQVHYKNENDISFTLSVNKDELDKDGKVYIDGTLLDKSKYTTTTSEDGVIVSLNKDYIDLLDVGNHEIKVSALHGDVTTSFVVNKRLINPSTGNKVVFIISIIALVSIGLLGSKRNLKSN